MKQNDAFIAIFCTFFCCLLFLTVPLSFASAKTQRPTPVGTRVQPPDLKDERRHTMESNTDRYSFHVEYPSLNNSLIDGAITLWALHQIEAFTQGLDEIPQTDTAKFSLNINFSLTPVSPKAVSIVFFITTEIGNEDKETGISTFTYDLEKGTLLQYESIFAQTETLFPFLSLYCYNALAKSPWATEAPSLLVAGTAPEPANFTFFSLDPVGITLYFPANQVAESRFGLQKVTVPLSELYAFQPDLRLWKKNTASATSGK